MFRSGVPMQVAQTNDILESAGMIDIRVYQNNEALVLKDGQNVEIDLASYKQAEGYDLYYLENDQRWSVTDTFKTVINPLKQRIKDSLAAISISPTDTTTPEEEFVFDLYIDTVNSPELKALHGLSWRIPAQFVDAKLRSSMRVHWNKVSVETVNKRKQQYKLVFERSLYVSDYDSLTTQKFSTPAEPFLSGKGGRKSRKNFKNQIAEFEAAIERLKQAEARIAKQAELVNQFKVNRFGIWNIDKVTSEQDYTTISVRFDFEQMKDVDPDAIVVYALYKEINTVIPYTKSSWKNIRFPVRGNMRLIAVLSDKKAAVVEDSEIRNVVSISGNNILLRTKQIPPDQITW